MTIRDYIKSNVFYDQEGQQIFFKKKDYGGQVLVDMSGWSSICKLFDGDTEKAAAFQDEVGQFIAEAINEKLSRDDEILKMRAKDQKANEAWDEYRDGMFNDSEQKKEKSKQ